MIKSLCVRIGQLLNINYQIPNINTKCHRLGRSDFPQTFTVDLVPGKNQFTSTQEELNVRGIIPPEHGQMIQGLLEESSLDLEVSCSIVAPNSSACPGRSIAQVSCSLAITLYGHFVLFDDIGTWLEEYHIHLQDPITVGKQDVKYCNPHRLSVEDINSCVLVSTCVSQNSDLGNLQTIEDRTDFLDVLSSHAELEEASQPEAVRTSLQKSVMNNRLTEDAVEFNADAIYLDIKSKRLHSCCSERKAGLSTKITTSGKPETLTGDFSRFQPSSRDS